MYNKIKYLLLLTIIGSCANNVQQKAKDNSKLYTKRAIEILDNVFVLKSKKDTLNYKDAIVLLDSAILCDSSNSFAYWKKSELLCELNMFNEALEIIVAYNKFNNKNFDYILREAFLYEKIGNAQMANKKYKFILNQIDNNLITNKNNKKLKINKLIILNMINNKDAKNYLIKLKVEFPNDVEISDIEYVLNHFSRTEFINQQLNVGNNDILIQ